MDIIAVGIPYIKGRGREVGQGRKADVTHTEIEESLE